MTTSSRQLTLASIAQACGVSASTVSRAFSRPDLVKDDVREQILAKAGELGYRPNRIARSLATGRLGVVGLVVSDITNPFFPPFIRAVQRAAAEQDWSVMLMDADQVTRDEASLISWVRGQADGVIVASPRSDDAKLRPLLEAIPAVMVNREMPTIASVVCDNSTALAEAGAHLSSLGHERVALLRGPERSWAAGRRAGAVRSWAESSGIDLVELGPYAATFESGQEAAGAVMESGATAAFAFDDLMAMGVVSGLAERGLRVPDDVSIVGCDDVLLARTATPALTTITAPMEALGGEAVQLLRAAFDREAPRSAYFDGVLTLRGSTGPRR